MSETACAALLLYGMFDAVAVIVVLVLLWGCEARPWAARYTLLLPLVAPLTLLGLMLWGLYLLPRGIAWLLREAA